MALPAAFFAAIFMSVARIGDDNELDAMLATGRSIARMAVPYFLVALALVGFNFYLFGYLQPLTRYGYNAGVHAARQTGWNARMEDNRFVTVKRGYTLGADSVGSDGRQLGGVFVRAPRRGGRGNHHGAQWPALAVGGWQAPAARPGQRPDRHRPAGWFGAHRAASAMRISTRISPRFHRLIARAAIQCAN